VHLLSFDLQDRQLQIKKLVWGIKKFRSYASLSGTKGLEELLNKHVSINP